MDVTNPEHVRQAVEFVETDLPEGEGTHAQQTLGIDLMLDQRWVSIVDIGPTLGSISSTSRVSRINCTQGKNCLKIID